MNESTPLLLKALNKEKLSTPPIWFMRQAGRYMPEYRKVRSKFKNFISGGRYDQLISDLGSKKKVPAVGAAINLK